jgi:hypothetical protein
MDKCREMVCETRAVLFSYKAPFSARTVFQCLEVFNETATEVQFLGHQMHVHFVAMIGLANEMVEREQRMKESIQKAQIQDAEQ